MKRTTPEMVSEIRELSRKGAKQKDIARRFGLSQGQVSRIISGRSWLSVESRPQIQQRKEIERSVDTKIVDSLLEAQTERVLDRIDKMIESPLGELVIDEIRASEDTRLLEALTGGFDVVPPKPGEKR